VVAACLPPDSSGIQSPVQIVGLGSSHRRRGTLASIGEVVPGWGSPVTFGLGRRWLSQRV